MWEFVKTGFEGNCILFGINIFDYKWVNTGDKIEVFDPQYNQKHILSVYNADIGTDVVIFATGEFSNGVYGFYVKQSSV